MTKEVEHKLDILIKNSDNKSVHYFVYCWNSVYRPLFKPFVEGTPTDMEVSFKWGDKVSDFDKVYNYTGGIKNPNFWSTFGDCVYPSITKIDGEIVIVVDVKERVDTLSHTRENFPTTRHISTFKNVPIKIIDEFIKCIEAEFESYLDKLYEEKLENDKKVWMKKKSLTLLNK